MIKTTNLSVFGASLGSQIAADPFLVAGLIVVGFPAIVWFLAVVLSLLTGRDELVERLTLRE